MLVNRMQRRSTKGRCLRLSCQSLSLMQQSIHLTCGLHQRERGSTYRGRCIVMQHDEHMSELIPAKVWAKGRVSDRHLKDWIEVDDQGMTEVADEIMFYAIGTCATRVFEKNGPCVICEREANCPEHQDLSQRELPLMIQQTK